MITRLLVAWAICASVQLVLWLVQQRTKNAGIVDVGWAATFTFVVLAYEAMATVPSSSWLLLASVVCGWSMRLSGYLLARGAATGPEEGRYADLRARWGARASVKFFVFFQAQALLTAVLSTAFVVPFVIEPSSLWPRVLGLAISIVSVFGEAMADAQLRQFKRAYPGRVCDRGLWAWSRHPNYFFEWCFWIGLAIYGIAFAPWGFVALVPQTIILASIFGVTGIPPTEAQALRSKGDAYRAYQRRVSRFIPMPPGRVSRK